MLSPAGRPHRRDHRSDRVGCRITDIQPDGRGAAAAMNMALEQAGIDPKPERAPIDYISAHGTGTQEGDSIGPRDQAGLRRTGPENPHGRSRA